MRVVLASESPQQREQVRRSVLSVGLHCESGDCVDLGGLPLRLARGKVDLVLVGLGPDRQRALPTIQEASLGGRRPVMAVGPAKDEAGVAEVLGCGAREYLDEARVSDELIAALDRLRRAGVVDDQQGKVVGLVSATPGSGVTTLSGGLAFALAQQKVTPVLLAEVGSGVPEFALNFNLQPKHTLKHLLREWDRVDATLFRQAVVEHAQGVHILCANTTGLTPPQVPGPAMRQMLVLARNLFPRSVFDFGHGLYEGTVEALPHLDEILIVTRLEIPALHLTRRLVRVLTQQYNAPADRIHLVGNRGNQRGQLSRQDVEEVLGYQLLGVVADEPTTTIKAQNEGLPLQEVAPRGRLCTSLVEMARRLQATPAA